MRTLPVTSGKGAENEPNTTVKIKAMKEVYGCGKTGKSSNVIPNRNSIGLNPHRKTHF